MGNSRAGSCIYCGGPLKRIKKGEHVIPKSLGGGPTLETVCSVCNGEFSRLDMELVSRTPLRFLIWRHLGCPDQDVWDWDAASGVALEAHLQPDCEAPKLWPQVVFRDDMATLHSDDSELRSRGIEVGVGEFLARLKSARATLRKKTGSSRWRWEAIKKLPREWRYPPRVFTKHFLGQIAPKSTFICRYEPPYGRGKILKMVDGWEPLKNRYECRTTLGTSTPETRMGFSPRLVTRALVKIALNTLAHCCKVTRVNKDTFPEAIAYARYDEGVRRGEREGCFALNQDLASLDCPPGSHKLCLTYDKAWRCEFLFFGGEMAAVVAFPGPSYEPWCQMEVTAPLRSKDWSSRESPIIVPRTVRVTWTEWQSVIPSWPVCNFSSQVTLQQRTREG